MLKCQGGAQRTFKGWADPLSCGRVLVADDRPLNRRTTFSVIPRLFGVYPGLEGRTETGGEP